MTLVSPARSPIPAPRGARLAPTHPELRLRSGELTLLASLATGAPISAVADLLGVSDRTIRRRIRTVCEQIGVDTPIEAVAWAARQRLI
jgi:DNA-binding NarL/FixJ family response regulator